MPSFRAVSLFSNCGAGDLGYRDAGFRFDVMAELQEHRLEVALRNHPGASGVGGDLRLTLPKVLAAWRQRRRHEAPALLAACPPCQGMSSARSGRGLENDPMAGSRDPRNLLVQVIVKATRELCPRSIVVENVPAFLTRQVVHPASEVSISAALLLIESLQADYEVWPLVTDLADHGVPQTRKRSFLTFIRREEPGIAVLSRSRLTPYPRPTHPGRPVVLRDALHAIGLRALDASSMATSADPERQLHRVPVWDETRYAMVAAIPPDSGRSAWQNSDCVTCGPVDADREAVKCPDCGQALPRPIVVGPAGARLISGFRRSSYARMNAAKPAATITTASGRIGSDNTLHPFENRVLSVLECQLLQTIPEDFDWGDVFAKKGHTEVRAMIGEAVPPAFTRQHGRVLRALLAGKRPYMAMPADDTRLRRAQQALAAGRPPSSSRLSHTSEPRQEFNT